MEFFSETGTQLLHRLEKRHMLTDLESKLFTDEFGDGSVVEITGEAGVGKSELLLHLIIKCITPSQWQNHDIGGFGVGVILIDNDLHFHILRLVSLLDNKLRRILQDKNVSASEEDVHQFITSCLNLLKLCHCRSSLQMIFTLQTIQSLMNCKYECCVLIIDSLSAFYWEDRLIKVDNSYNLQSYYRHLADILQKLSRDDKFVILFTRQQLITSDKPHKSDANHTDVNEDIYYMGKDIKNLVNWRLHLSKDNISKALVFTDIKHKGQSRRASFTIGSDGIKFM